MTNTHLVGDMSIHSTHPLAESLEGRKVVLGSQSPRRVELLKALNIPFEVRPSNASEEHSAVVHPEDLPLVLAKRKAECLKVDLAPDEILITADTIVILDRDVLEKPKNLDEAHSFLQRLSSEWHTVVTGYCITTTKRQFQSSAKSRIRFNALAEEEIAYYLDHYQVLDKAGAYGIQDWIGLIGIAEIVGSYHNVMGLPTAQLYQDLKVFLKNKD